MSHRIAEIRKSSGITQRELATEAGISANHLSDIETGRVAQPSFKTIQRLVRGLTRLRAEEGLAPVDLDHLAERL